MTIKWRKRTKQKKKEGRQRFDSQKNVPRVRFKCSTSSRPGPVLLELSLDLRLSASSNARPPMCHHRKAAFEKSTLANDDNMCPQAQQHLMCRNCADRAHLRSLHSWQAKVPSPEQ